MKKTTILLVEDNRILRDGIKALLGGHDDLKIVGASAGGADTLAHIVRLKPQVVLVDLSLRGLDSLGLVKGIVKESPESKVIGMGLFPLQKDVVEFVQAGAAGFILKNASVRDVIATVRAVAQGASILPPILAGSLFAHVVERAIQEGKGVPPSAVRMSKREREIIVIVAEGLSNKDIAQRLNLSIYTVKSHVHNILEKMALHSRLQIASHSYQTKGD